MCGRTGWQVYWRRCTRTACESSARAAACPWERWDMGRNHVLQNPTHQESFSNLPGLPAPRFPIQQVCAGALRTSQTSSQCCCCCCQAGTHTLRSTAWRDHPWVKDRAVPSQASSRPAPSSASKMQTR